MSVYELEADEAVIMQENDVSAGKGTVSLILTDRRLIQINKGLFGGDKNAEYFLLADLKELKGKPNILIGKTPTGEKRLELYFSGFEKYYSFSRLFAERKWADAIEKTYLSLMNNREKGNRAENGNPLISPLKETLDTAKRFFTPKEKEPKTKTIKCPTCGNMLTGAKGHEKPCEYCQSIIRF